MSRNGVGLASLEILQETRRLRLRSSVLRPRQPNFVPWEKNHFTQSDSGVLLEKLKCARKTIWPNSWHAFASHLCTAGYNLGIHFSWKVWVHLLVWLLRGLAAPSGCACSVVSVHQLSSSTQLHTATKAAQGGFLHITSLLSQSNPRPETDNDMISG